MFYWRGEVGGALINICKYPNALGWILEKENDDRINVSRHKIYKYFVNVINVAQNIEESVQLAVIYFF
jgi:hypothetical protein